MLLRGELILYEFRYLEFDSQFEFHILLRPSPHEILEVACTLLYCGIEIISNQITKKGHDVEQRALAAGVGTNEYVKAIETDVRVAETAVIERLDAANHANRIAEVLRQRAACILAERWEHEQLEPPRPVLGVHRIPPTGGTRPLVLEVTIYE